MVRCCLQVGGLDGKMEEGGDNLSVGQRQLFCLARFDAYCPHLAAIRLCHAVANSLCHAVATRLCYAAAVKLHYAAVFRSAVSTDMLLLLPSSHADQSSVLGVLIWKAVLPGTGLSAVLHHKLHQCPAVVAHDVVQSACAQHLGCILHC